MTVPQDNERRKRRHRGGEVLREGVGLTTGLGWSDSEDEDAPSPLTRRLRTLTMNSTLTRKISIAMSVRSASSARRPSLPPFPPRTISVMTKGRGSSNAHMPSSLALGQRLTGDILPALPLRTFSRFNRRTKRSRLLLLPSASYPPVVSPSSPRNLTLLP